MSRLHSYGLLFLTLVLALSAPRMAHAAQDYENCTGFITSVPATISTPGTWCFNQNLSTAITNGAAIAFNAADVTIDCNDFKLDGLAAGLATNTYGFANSNFANATVRNCNIRGFFFGLRFTGTNGGHVIEDNRFQGNTYAGLLVQGDHSVIRRNRVFDTGGTTSSPASGALAIATTYSVDILDNTISGVVATSGGGGSAEGMEPGFNETGSISGNRIRGLVKDGSGVVLAIYANASDRVTLRNNELVGDASAGSVGLQCGGSNSRAKDNVIKGFVTGLSFCSNDGGNVIKP